MDPSAHFVDKNLDRKLAMKLRKKHNLSKGTRAYDFVDIQDQSLRFTVQLLAGGALRKCRPNEVPARSIDLVAQAKEGKQYK